MPQRCLCAQAPTTLDATFPSASAALCQRSLCPQVPTTLDGRKQFELPTLQEAPGEAAPEEESVTRPLSPDLKRGEAARRTKALAARVRVRQPPTRGTIPAPHALPPLP